MSTTPSPPIQLLIADDDYDDYLIFSLALEETKVHYTLSREANGRNLLNRLTEGVPDILFLDIIMPYKDGRQCLKEIRSDHRYDLLPIIVLTSMNDPQTIDYCYKEKSNLFAVKPDSIQDLKIILERVININWKTSYYPTKHEFVITA